MKKLSSLIHISVLTALLGQTVISSGYAAEVSETELLTSPAPRKNLTPRKAVPVARKKVSKTLPKQQNPKNIAERTVTKTKNAVRSVVDSDIVQSIAGAFSIVKENLVYTAKEYKLCYIDSGQWKEILFDSSFMFLNNVATGYIKRHNGIFKESMDDRKFATETAQEEVQRIATETANNSINFDKLQKIAQDGVAATEEISTKKELLKTYEDTLTIINNTTNTHSISHTIENMEDSLVTNLKLEKTKANLSRLLTKIMLSKQNDESKNFRHLHNLEFKEDIKNLSSKKIAQKMLESIQKKTAKIGVDVAHYSKSTLPSGMWVGKLRFPVSIDTTKSYLQGVQNPLKNAASGFGIRSPFITEGKNFFSSQGVSFRWFTTPIEGKYPKNRYTEYYGYYNKDKPEDNKVGSFHRFTYALACNTNFWSAVIQEFTSPLLKPLLFKHQQTAAYRTFCNNRRKLDKGDGGELRATFTQAAVLFSEVTLGGFQNVSNKKLAMYTRFGANFLDEKNPLKKGFSPKIAEWLINKSGMGPKNTWENYSYTRIVVSALLATVIEKVIPIAANFLCDFITNTIIRTSSPAVDQAVEGGAPVPAGPPAAVKQQILGLALSGQEEQLEYLMQIHNVTPEQLQEWINTVLVNGIKTIE